MLSLAAKVWPGQVEAATVDHGLRPEAQDEAAMVARWCVEQGVPHVTLHPEAPIRGNLQSEARAVRYALLRSWYNDRRLNWLLTAHHADDQIETLIMRLNRGSGVGGLAGVRARQDQLLRPMLGFRRAELRAYCEQRRVPFVDDPSNVDPHFDRARLRAKLAGHDLFDPARLARSLDALAEADDALDWAARQIIERNISDKAGVLVLDQTDFPPAILRRVLMHMIEKINPDATSPRGPSIDQALVQLFDGKTVTLADCVVTGGKCWTVCRAPPRRVG